MAVGTNLQNVLGGRQLSGTIELIKPGLPTEQLPPGLLSPTLGIEGVSHVMRQREGTRRTPARVEYGAPSRRYTPKGVSEKPVVLNHFSHNTELKAATLVNLESDNGQRQRLGESEVERIVNESKVFLENGRAASVMSAFALGKIHYNSDGELLPSSSGAQVTIDYGIPSGNLNQLAINGGSAVIDASWANPATKIVKQMTNLTKASGKFTNYKPAVAMYGSKIPDFLYNNDQVQAYMKNNQRFQDAFVAGMIPDDFLGIKKWFPAYLSYFEDSSGTQQEIFASDSITFIPEVSTDWYGFVEGTTPIPGSFGTSKPDLAAVLRDVFMQRGMFAYAYGTVDPVGATMVFGDTYLPEILVPNAVFIADVEF